MALILVVGGAGFIGSHMMKTLAKSGHDAVAFDNLSTGHADAVIYGDLVEGDLAKPDQIKDVLVNGHFDGVMHFASNIEVGESVTDPCKYYTNNVTNALNLIHAMMDQGLNNLIFSSTTTLDEMVDEMVGHDLDQAKRIRILRERGFDVALDQE